MSTQLDQIRKVIREKTANQDPLQDVERISSPTEEQFREYAIQSKPVIVTDEVDDWPLLGLTIDRLREDLGEDKLTVRKGDYVAAAFSPEREFVEVSLNEYLDWISKGIEGDQLPPYLGNNELPDVLTEMVTRPRFYPAEAYNAPRLWLGPAGAITALHYDFTDNLFVQVWGDKRFILFPPHHEQYLYTWDPSQAIRASRFDPENPDYEAFPLSHEAEPVVCDVGPGEMLFLPGTWFHYVRSLDLSLSVNFFVGRVRPFAAFPPGTRF